MRGAVRKDGPYRDPSRAGTVERTVRPAVPVTGLHTTPAGFPLRPPPGCSLFAAIREHARRHGAQLPALDGAVDAYRWTVDYAEAVADVDPAGWGRLVAGLLGEYLVTLACDDAAVAVRGALSRPARRLLGALCADVPARTALRYVATAAASYPGDDPDWPLGVLRYAGGIRRREHAADRQIMPRPPHASPRGAS